MAVKLINTVRKYIGYETDDKPTGDDIPDGSEFYEYDSALKFLRAVYMWFDGEWQDV